MRSDLIGGRAERLTTLGADIEVFGLAATSFSGAHTLLCSVARRRLLDRIDLGVFLGIQRRIEKVLITGSLVLPQSVLGAGSIGLVLEIGALDRF